MSDNIFPVLDRRAPLAERIRGDGPLSNGDSESTGSEDLAELVIEISSVEDEDAKEEIIEEAKKDFRASLASSAQVEEEMVNNSVVEFFGEFLDNSESDVIDPEGLKSLGLLDGDSQEDVEVSDNVIEDEDDMDDGMEMDEDEDVDFST